MCIGLHQCSGLVCINALHHEMVCLELHQCSAPLLCCTSAVHHCCALGRRRRCRHSAAVISHSLQTRILLHSAHHLKSALQLNNTFLAMQCIHHNRRHSNAERVDIRTEWWVLSLRVGEWLFLRLVVALLLLLVGESSTPEQQQRLARA